jgi:hypothetical protein
VNTWNNVVIAGAALGLGPEQVIAIAEQFGDEDALIAGSPSFDLSYPKIPGRDVEGINNANDPVMREKLRQRLLRNPSGTEQLPPFLRGV